MARDRVEKNVREKEQKRKRLLSDAARYSNAQLAATLGIAASTMGKRLFEAIDMESQQTNRSLEELASAIDSKRLANGVTQSSDIEIERCRRATDQWSSKRLHLPPNGVKGRDASTTAEATSSVQAQPTAPSQANETDGWCKYGKTKCEHPYCLENLVLETVSALDEADTDLVLDKADSPLDLVEEETEGWCKYGLGECEHDHCLEGQVLKTDPKLALVAPEPEEDFDYEFCDLVDKRPSQSSYVLDKTASLSRDVSDGNASQPSPQKFDGYCKYGLSECSHNYCLENLLLGVNSRIALVAPEPEDDIKLEDEETIEADRTSTTDGYSDTRKLPNADDPSDPNETEGWCKYNQGECRHDYCLEKLRIKCWTAGLNLARVAPNPNVTQPWQE
ncbi:hypothetical protein LTR37_018214 [Vermiconidia calcicola]|uniref:Uncharacterized protein n=1 Tax=Vermiconidia calcicola TaxID=1690605 RepID=A0ACC3MHP6_9PEZI|nr:hypothetical protein LTR37_018214 [Vermiconidia calcicola]